jgi:chromate reductase, NAD(P)H dehydrogenase (quinone)
MKILGICGSLRRGSFNRLALLAAAELAPPGVTLEVYDSLKDIPLFDSDEMGNGFPPAVQRLREAIRGADAVLFASPEYNFSVSGVLKNTIDYVSRGVDQPFNGKPFAILSASMGPLGGARSQYDLRKTMVFLNGHGLNKPEVFIGSAQTRFDDSGKLTDEPTRKALAAQLLALRDHALWVARANGGASGSAS